ncbi:MAG: DNA replication/repair protein RecF [Chloroflexota bacterium]|nr:DNA replication/repair protein RecF [Chloroflexota bacterium]
MHVDRLTLGNFRSYGTLDVRFDGGPQVIVGANAAGKTNLLEALLVLGTGGSHRASSDAELISWGADFARLEAAVDGGAGTPAAIEIVLARSGPAGARKRVRINGVGRRAAQLAAALPVVLFAPEDMSLISGSPGLRRHAVDGLIMRTTPTAAATIATYTRALSQRNNLLRAIRDGMADPAELRFWNEVICRDGGQIVTWRRAVLAGLAAPLAEVHHEIAPDDAPLSLRYVSNAEAGPDEDAEAALRRRLAETAEKELWNGSTLVGPHRDDVEFSLGGRDLAVFGSRGQQRSAILSFKLAELGLVAAAHGQPPLLLLDDVFSELDPQRRAHLVRRIGALPQAFVTTTALDDLDPALVAASTPWRVSGGRLVQLAGRVAHAG